MDNFCINCGAKLGKDYNFCINCGTKIDKSDMKDSNNPFNSMHPNEKEKAKYELKQIVGGKIFFNKSFRDELLRNDLNDYAGAVIKEQLEKEIESGQLKSGDVESRKNQLIAEYKIQKEKSEKARIAKSNEMKREKVEHDNKKTSGGYCSFNCAHYCEEFLDSYGAIVGDFDSTGYVEYYCNLGHSISHGSFCKDYE